MASVKSYFECHAHHYHKESGLYLPHIKFIPHADKITILDVACGDGNFIKEMISSGVRAEFVGIDVSYELLSSAKENLKSYSVDLCLADAFNMPFLPDHKFDVIHIDALLHHLIGGTKGKSTDLVKRMISLLMDKLSDNGTLMVDEYYYNSYIAQSLTSSIVFYALKALNFFHIDASKILPDVQPGLEVNFLTENQVRSILREHTPDVQTIRKTPTEQYGKIHRLCFLKEAGRISVIAINKKHQ